MPDVRGDKVEGWKLSPEQVSFQRKFKKLKQAREALQMLSQVEKERMLALREAWQQLAISYDGLAKELPESAVRKPQGMQFPDETQGQAGDLPPLESEGAMQAYMQQMQQAQMLGQFQSPESQRIRY
jgi:hypothetical protein